MATRSTSQPGAPGLASPFDGPAGRPARVGPFRPPRPVSKGRGTATVLGLASLGLGLAGAALPRRVAGIVGLEPTGAVARLIRLVGARELASGVGLLLQPGLPAWSWLRVFGDAMDLTVLGLLLRRASANPGRLGTTLAVVGGLTVFDLFTAARLSRPGGPAAPVRHAITIRREPEEVYRFWRDFTNLPRFMRHLESVELTGERGSRWTAHAPAGRRVHWEAAIVTDRPNELIAWQSLPGADVPSSGRVHFRPAPAGQGTELEVELTYSPPAGALGRSIARLFGEEPSVQIKGDLRRLKQVLELGEVVRTDATLEGTGLPQRPGRPPEQVTPDPRLSR